MKQAIYFALPPAGCNLAALVAGWQRSRRRLGGDFPRWREYFTRNAGRSAEDIQAEQLETAEVWLREVCAKVPYYESILNASFEGRAPKLRSWVDLARLPSLPKERE
jgi:hypothetical protein